MPPRRRRMVRGIPPDKQPGSSDPEQRGAPGQGPLPPELHIRFQPIVVKNSMPYAKRSN